MSRIPLFGIYDVRTPEEKYADGWEAAFGKRDVVEDDAKKSKSTMPCKACNGTGKEIRRA